MWDRLKQTERFNFVKSGKIVHVVEDNFNDFEWYATLKVTITEDIKYVQGSTGLTD